MAKGKTLRKNHKPLKKTYIHSGGQPYIHSGGQPSLDYKDFQDIYASNLEKKKAQYENILKEGNQLYDIETSNATNTYYEKVAAIVSFISDFTSSKEVEFNDVKDSISSSLELYGEKYTSYFIPSIKTYEQYINELYNLVSYSKIIQNDFLNRVIHIHLLNQRFELLSQAKSQTNKIQEQIVLLKESIDKIKKVIENEKIQHDTILKSEQASIEAKKLELVNAIGIVKRDYPETYIPKVLPFIQGCPLGTVLEGESCNYYNDSQLIESVPLQKSLIVNDTSEWVVWFNNRTPSNVNEPVVFKRKPLQYLLKLSNEDAKYFNALYVVCESNGTPYKDPNGYFIFISNIIEIPLDIPGFNKYYISDDTYPQAVQVVNNGAPLLRAVMNETKYFCALSDVDQIISGIKYIETDAEGNFKEIVPFYPTYNGFTSEGNNFTKKALNNIDTITYKFVKKMDKQVENLNKKTIFETSSLDPYTPNLISNLYKNSYVSISIEQYFNTFILPQFFLNVGDYFILHNNGTHPFILNISSNSSEQRVVVYPRQLCCFVFSTNINSNLRYGFLNLDRFESFQTRSSSVAKFNNTYVFVENSTPLYDSEHNLIEVPNFNSSNKTYYEFDDIFETSPKSISEIVAVNIPNESLSLDHHQYSSPYATLTSVGNTFVFCDASGIPNLDLFGYFIPVPSPLHYIDKKFVWYALEKQKNITLVSKYVGVIYIDESYNFASQYQSEYSTLLNNIQVFINSSGLPLVANESSFLAVPENTSTTQKQVQLFLPPEFKITQMDTTLAKQQVQSELLIGYIKIYTQNAQILEDTYSDLSGNMNNISALKSQLLVILNDIQVNKNIQNLDNYELQAKELYESILKTKAKLEIYRQEKTITDIHSAELDKNKQIRLNELALVKSKLDKLNPFHSELNQSYETLKKSINDSINLTPFDKQTLLDKLQPFPSDLVELKKSIENLEKSYMILKTSIENSYDNPSSQEENTNILLKSAYAIEKNINSEKQTLDSLSVYFDSTQLSSKNDEKNKLVSLINNELLYIDTIKKQLNDIPSSQEKDTIQTSLDHIQRIIDTVSLEQKSLATPTVDTIANQINVYQNYLEKSIPEEKAIISSNFNILQQYKDSLDASNLTQQKQVLLNAIQQFNKKNEEINQLLNSLSNRLDDDQKHKFEEELLENYNIVQNIETNVNTLSDVEASIKRVDEISNLNDTLQNELQVIELNKPEIVPSPVAETVIDLNVAPVATINAPAPQTGGKIRKTRKANTTSKRKTRKH